MKKLLNDFQFLLENNNYGIVKYFNQGLNNQNILTLFSENNLIPNNEILELYEWHNGTKYNEIPTGKINFGVNGCFLPLEDSLKLYEYNIAKRLYKKGYFPVFSNDDYLVNLDCQSPNYGKVYLYSPSLLIIKPIQCFDSLYSMFETFYKSFDSKVLDYDIDGFFQIDFEDFEQIAKLNNPNSKYWN